MVFSKELGYDPDEWEECSDSEQFMLFGFTTRMFLTLTSIIFTIFFFWLIEARKQLDKSREVEKVSVKNINEGKLEKLETVKEKLKQLGKLGQSEANFSKEETEALEEWQREVARMEELRLQDLVEHVIDASGMMSETETESQLIDHLLPADRISLETDSGEMELFQTQRLMNQRTFPMASNNFAVQASTEAAVNLASDVKNANAELIARIRDAANTLVTDSKGENGSVSSTNGWEAPAQSEFFVENASEFIYKPGSIGENNVLISDIHTSMENDDGFVKVYKDELQMSNGAELSRETAALNLPDPAIPEVLKQGQSAITDLSADQLSVPVVLANYMTAEEERQGASQYHQGRSRKPDDEAFVFLPVASMDASISQIAPEAFTGRGTDIDMMNREGLITTPRNEPITEAERKRLAEAEIYVQDAIEYVASETRPEPVGFMVEEALIHKRDRNDDDAGGRFQQQQQQQQRLQLPVSSEATSEMIPTNEVFEKIEEPMEMDDAMTYAPEIQSIEIPPDQASVNSENLLEYFDQVAAECTDIVNMPLLQPVAGISSISKSLEQPSQSVSLLRNSRSYTSSGSQPRIRKRSSLLSVLGVTSMQEMLLALTSLEDLSDAMRKAGLQSTNLIFGIDYTASNKYQGERCFQGRSLHSLDAFKENPYQQVIKIMGRILAPFATSGYIPAYGFGDVKTSDWSVFKLKPEGECRDLDDLLQVYDTVTPTISLSGPTNFAPLIYEAIGICEKLQNYHILVIIADGQVTNEKATRKAIVRACQYPLSIIVVGVGDGPWDMMKVFDESLPRRPWDNFHFVEFHEVMKKADSIDAGELSFAVQSLLEIPDQYNVIRKLGLLRHVAPVAEQNE
uniref:VWFA domain-containing protein n=1 Tax=Setaria digitata TaxID=48799 RepID=A0A915PN83_9BILA